MTVLVVESYLNLLQVVSPSISKTPISPSSRLCIDLINIVSPSYITGSMLVPSATVAKSTLSDGATTLSRYSSTKVIGIPAATFPRIGTYFLYK